MALVRILVDGNSLLHQWLELAPGKARLSAAACEELIHKLTQYYDACGTPILVVVGAPSGVGGLDVLPSTPEVEIVSARAGQTVRQLLERAAHRFSRQGEVLLVTDSAVEGVPFAANGFQWATCRQFVQMVGDTLSDLEREIQNYNQREQFKFTSTR